MRRFTSAAAATVLFFGTAAVAVAVPKSTSVDSSKLRKAVELDDIRDHQEELQEIADENNGTRASGTPGFQESADYVFKTLRKSGYRVTRQQFEFPFFQELSDPIFNQLTPNNVPYTANDPAGFFTLQYSGSGTAAELVVPTTDINLNVLPNDPPGVTNSGCEPADFPATVAGRIALIQRGTCTFQLKAENAQAAGAIAVIIFNEGQTGRQDAVSGTLGGPTVTIPVIGTTFAIGAELYNADIGGDVTVQVTTDTISEQRLTENIIADSRRGDPNSIIVVGAHLDSVLPGPGINDNGSGTATILEIAREIGKKGIRTKHRLRFALWGAEESGLLGSEHYVANLSPEELAKIKLNLNFDMLGSPNFVRFVYDGDGSDTPNAGPPGSDAIEQVFLDYFAEQGLETEPTAFDGRSDYGPFIDVGIPAGGLFSGAEGIKTAEEAGIYGGTAGEAYDHCYHQACDTFDNNNDEGLDQLADAAAHAVLYWGQTDLPTVTTAAKQRARAISMDYKGSHLVR